MTNKLYHKAREYMLKRKLKWVEQASGKSKGSLLDIGAGTNEIRRMLIGRELIGA